MGWTIAGSLLVAVAGGLMIVYRRQLAHMQALLAGGNITPGCAVAEGIVLLVLAVVVCFVERSY